LLTKKGHSRLKVRMLLEKVGFEQEPQGRDGYGAREHNSGVGKLNYPPAHPTQTKSTPLHSQPGGEKPERITGKGGRKKRLGIGSKGTLIFLGGSIWGRFLDFGRERQGGQDLKETRRRKCKQSRTILTKGPTHAV